MNSTRPASQQAGPNAKKLRTRRAELLEANVDLDDLPIGYLDHLQPLAGFTATAAIDFIKFGARADLFIGLGKHARLKVQERFAGRVEIPGRKSWSDQGIWITIQDPRNSDLQQLIDDFPEVPLLALEIAVDFHWSGPEPVLANRWLFRELAHAHAPQAHSDMATVWEKQAVKRVGKEKFDYKRRKAMGRPTSTASMVWESPTGLQTRLYIKNIERQDADGVLTVTQVVRLEATLKNLAGTQRAGVQLVGQIPHAAQHLRRFITPMLSIGQGLRRTGARMRPERLKNRAHRQEQMQLLSRQTQQLDTHWDRYGASYARKRRLPVRPNKIANAVVQRAIKALVGRLGRLTPPKNVAEYPAWVQGKFDLIEVFPQGRPASYRLPAA